jgi:hypothetical protein
LEKFLDGAKNEDGKINIMMGLRKT